MILLELLWAFLRVGLFAFGGAYGAIPLIRDIVLSYGWLTEDMFTYFVAVCESTPGPIMVNMATYIGSSQAGLWGGVFATIGVVLPAFIIIIVIVTLMKNLIDNKYVQAVLKGIFPCFIGIILATGIYFVVNNILGAPGTNTLDWKAILLTAILFSLSFGYQRIKKKTFSPILLIIISAGMGMLLY